MKPSGKPWPPRFPPAPRGTEARTLTEIENHDWGRPDYDSHLVQRCHELRHKPVGTLTAEDLRILIGQGISLTVLIPVALAVLKQDPFAEGDFFPGDLLKNVLQVEAAFWKAHAVEAETARDVAKRALSVLEESGRTTDPGQVCEVVRRFLAP